MGAGEMTKISGETIKGYWINGKYVGNEEETYNKIK